MKDIPKDLNPLSGGVLMKHQGEWCALQADLKLASKGRRTGITFAEALDDTLIAGSQKKAGGDNIYYIPDTKDKGLEFIGYCSHFARVIAEAQSSGISRIEEFLFEDQADDGSTRMINAYRIRFSSGFSIVALSSRPANIRGLQGIVVIDEAAFHQNVAAVLEAATALLIWGGKIRVISSHNGRKNAFNQLRDDIEKGRYGTDAKVYTATFDDAVRNGLFERVCMMRQWEATAEAKKKWYTKIRSSYGPRKAAMREELDAIPRDGGGKSIPGVWIDRSMKSGRPVLRLSMDDDFVKKPDFERKLHAEVFIQTQLLPLMKLLDPRLQTVFGMDFARHRNFTVITPLQIMQTLRRSAPFVLELHNVPSRQQEQILWAFIKMLPMWRGGAMDATGPGLTLAEYTADEFGHDMIHQVMLSKGWYAEFMPKMVKNFEDDQYDLPADVNIDEDLRAVEDVDGIPRVPEVNTKDLKEPELFRHGDFAISLVLAEFSAINMSAPMEFTSDGMSRGGDLEGFLYG
ncbi:MAG: hypothetical protein RBS05_05945 [Zoogloea oleivorans]|uniref:hypothetical protein n=1 Tax=Zoogloea oleivorans TaxID=1552750 RepID=UPI002A363ED7|nr:hypothetical protein [Zoogloea oleivorans]MDY0035439.1 hypothetical protein [Zoogloea oleivorans]